MSLTSTVPTLLSDAALAYAWCKVCFTAWDETLDAAGERILRYSRWPSILRALLHAIYPAYFVYASMKKLNGPEESLKQPQKWALLLAIACAAAGLVGAASSLATAVQRCARDVHA